MCIKVYIPYTTINSRILRSEVIESIRNQQVTYELIECSFIGPKRENIAMAKSVCRDKAIKEGYDYVVIHDQDYLHLYDNNFLLMKNLLMNNNEYGAVSLAKSDLNGAFLEYDIEKNHHIGSGVIMFRQDVLKDIKFDIFKDSCTCLSIGRSLYLINKKYRYLDNVMRIKHLGK